MQKYKLFGLAPPIWVAQYIYSIDIQRIIKCESKRCQSQAGKIVEVTHEEVQEIGNKVQPLMTLIMKELVKDL